MSHVVRPVPRPALLLVASALAGFAALAPAHAQPTGARAGKWEVARTIASSDPQAASRSVTAVRCFSEADVARPERLVPSLRETDERCTARDVKATGPTIAWRSTCEMPGVSRTGTGSITVSAERFEGTARLEGRVGNRTVRSTHTIAAKRVGDCP
jgi:hypothetical protein